MPARPLALAGLLGAAVGGPYMVSQAPDDWPSPWNEPAAEQQPADPAPTTFDLRPPDLSGPNGPGSDLYQSPASLAGPVGIPLDQALNWNVTKNWVYRNWARKSTGLADPTLFGVRVPLVTGSGMTDVAGSLTYYFDGMGVLQRMRLSGRTADTSRLVHMASSRFGMQPRQPRSAGDQLLQSVEGGKLRGQLVTRPEGVLWATSPHSSFDVQLEVTRPGSEYVVTPRLPELALPEGVAPQVASRSDSDKAPGKPILPARSLVPDAAAPPQAEAADTEKAEAEAQDVLQTPKLPKIGSPEAAPPAQVKSLDGYRDRFRWPG